MIPSNPDTFSLYLVLADSTANVLYDAYDLIPSVKVKSIRNSHSPRLVKQWIVRTPYLNSPVKLPNPSS